MNWRSLTDGELLAFWASRGGTVEHIHRDRNAFARLLEHYSPVAIAGFILDEGPGETPWSLERRMKGAELPEGRVALEMSLVASLRRHGLLPEMVKVPWIAWTAYEDLRYGLGIPSAPLNNAFESAKRQLETWLDTEFLTIPVPVAAHSAPSGGGSYQRRNQKPGKRRVIEDFEYLG